MSRYLVWLLGGGSVAAAGAVALWLTTGMRDAPAPGGTASAPATSPGVAAPDAGSAPRAAGVSPEPAIEVATPAPDRHEPAPAEPAPPTFDVVRVARDGAALVAGSAAPGAAVTLRVDGAVVAEAAADGGGQFVAMFSLAPGDVPQVMTLEMQDAAGVVVLSADTVILSPRPAELAMLAPDAEAAPGELPQREGGAVSDAGVPSGESSQGMVVTEPLSESTGAAVTAGPADAGPPEAAPDLTAGTDARRDETDVSPLVSEAGEAEVGEAAVVTDAADSPAAPEGIAGSYRVDEDRLASSVARAGPETGVAEAPVAEVPVGEVPIEDLQAGETPLADASQAADAAVTRAGDASAMTDGVAADASPEIAVPLAAADAPAADDFAPEDTLMVDTPGPQESGAPGLVASRAAVPDRVAEASVEDRAESAGIAAGAEADSPSDRGVVAEAVDQELSAADSSPASAASEPAPVAGVADALTASGSGAAGEAAQSAPPAPENREALAGPAAGALDSAALAGLAGAAGTGSERAAETGTAAVAEAVAAAGQATEAGEGASAPAVVEDLPTAILLRGDGQIQVMDRAPRVMDNVVIDTISYSDTGDVQISGRAVRAESGADLRVYLDNRPIAIAQAEGGDWRLDLPAIDPGVYMLRVDQLNPAGRVVSRFETPFQRETPERVAAAQAAARETAARETAARETAARETVARETAAQETAVADGGPAVISEAPSGGVEPPAAALASGDTGRGAPSGTAATGAAPLGETSAVSAPDYLTAAGATGSTAAQPPSAASRSMAEGAGAGASAASSALAEAPLTAAETRGPELPGPETARPETARPVMPAATAADAEPATPPVAGSLSPTTPVTGMPAETAPSADATASVPGATPQNATPQNATPQNAPPQAVPMAAGMGEAGTVSRSDGGASGLPSALTSRPAQGSA
ncbi:MAG: hypothetical protein ACK4GT_04495, partial [Pararhodobacter sp.]